MPKPSEVRGCFDLDGVLGHYTHYTGENIGPPNEEGLKLIRMAALNGHKIIIQTCRTHHRWGPEAFQRNYLNLVAWLKMWNVPYDYIETQGKAVAHYYVDDRAVFFPPNHGPAEEVYKQIQLRLMNPAQSNYDKPGWEE